MTINLRALLEEMIEKEASDLHITAGERAKLRVDGDMGSKHAYDPRPYMTRAENAMAARVVRATTELRSAGTTMMA